MAFWYLDDCLVFFVALVNPSGSEATLNVLFKWKKRATQGFRTQLYIIKIIYQCLILYTFKSWCFGIYTDLSFFNHLEHGMEWGRIRLLFSRVSQKNNSQKKRHVNTRNGSMFSDITM